VLIEGAEEDELEKEEELAGASDKGVIEWGDDDDGEEEIAVEEKGKMTVDARRARVKSLLGRLVDELIR
jgi:hypothetical protein